MTTSRRASLRLARQRRRRAATSALRTTARPPIALHVLLRHNTPPDVRAVYEEAARRIEAIAQVRITLADLSAGVPVQILLPGDGTVRVLYRHTRATVAFSDAIGGGPPGEAPIDVALDVGVDAGHPAPRTAA